MFEEEDVQELGLTIPLKSFYDEFLCPICFSLIKNCHVTPCGHHFCGSCIVECVNRKHVCPCCNAATTKAQLIHDHWFDKVLATVQHEKEESSKNYFSKLVSGQDVLRSSRERPVTNTRALSPVEEVFQRHMQKSLASYEAYYQELKAKFEKAKAAARSEFAAKCVAKENEIDTAMGKGTEKAKKEMEKALGVLTQECENKISAIDQSLNECVDNLVQACEGFLKERTVEPRLAGLLVNLSIPSRGIRMERIQLRPTDAPNDLSNLLDERLRVMGKPLASVSPDAYFVLRTPLGEEIVLKDRSRPLLQYEAPPGCEIELRGQVKLQGDAPEECFTLRFRKGVQLVESYYVCKDCNITWVCEACAKECHKGHNVINYMPNHKPSWACCYCPKNRKCTIPNAKTTRPAS